MPKKCIISGCKSGYSSNAERVSLFKVPSDEVLYAKWIKAVTPAKKIQLKKSHTLCKNHFLPSDIVRNFVHKDEDGRITAKVTCYIFFPA